MTQFDEQVVNSRLTFRQAMDKAKFTVLLMALRMENPDERIPFTLFSFGPKGMVMTPVSDQFFASEEGRAALAHSNFPNVAKQNEAWYMFFALSAEFDYPDPLRWGVNLRRESAFVHGVSKYDSLVHYAPITRRRFGNPLLGKWEEWGEHFEYTDPLLSFMVPSLAEKPVV